MKERESGRTVPLFGPQERAKLQRICEAVGRNVPDDFIRPCEEFLEELLKWNRKTSLVSRADEKRLVERHVLDSLCILAVEPDLSEKLVMDMGSGAGFPGLVLAMWEPKAQLRLVESRKRKVSFLNAVRRRLSLENVDVLPVRLEESVELSADKRVTRIDLFVSRGIRITPSLANLFSDMTAVGTRIVLYESASSADKLMSSALLRRVNLSLELIRPPWQELTTLVVLTKR